VSIGYCGGGMIRDVSGRCIWVRSRTIGIGVISGHGAQERGGVARRVRHVCARATGDNR